MSIEMTGMTEVNEPRVLATNEFMQLRGTNLFLP